MDRERKREEGMGGERERGEREREREREREADRRRDRRAERQTDRQADTLTDRERQRQTYRQAEKDKTDRELCRSGRCKPKRLKTQAVTEIKTLNPYPTHLTGALLVSRAGSALCNHCTKS